VGVWAWWSVGRVDQIAVGWLCLCDSVGGTPPGGLPWLKSMVSVVCVFRCLQNIHSEWVRGKILFLNGLARISRLRGFYLCIKYSGWGGTATPRDCAGLARGLVVLGVDRFEGLRERREQATAKAIDQSLRLRLRSGLRQSGGRCATAF